MPNQSKSEKPSSIDIFQDLTDTAENERKKKREELLGPLHVKEFFVEGKIRINKRTCRGIDCNLCVKACPTKALFWKAGELGITEELCVYCGACVVNCIVDDCIEMVRLRENGEVERFSRPREILLLENNINTRKRVERIESVCEALDSTSRKKVVRKEKKS
jgi:ferredoxin